MLSVWSSNSNSLTRTFCSIALSSYIEIIYQILSNVTAHFYLTDSKPITPNTFTARLSMLIVFTQRRKSDRDKVKDTCYADCIENTMLNQCRFKLFTQKSVKWKWNARYCLITYRCKYTVAIHMIMLLNIFNVFTV